MDYSDIDSDGELSIPTIRGSANLDMQDYQDVWGQSDFLDDGLQEDVPSTPGRNPGAASATDIDGTDDFDMLSVPGGMDATGMKQTTYGAHPWGPGSNAGYRPYSQQRTDMSLRALGDEGSVKNQPEPERMEYDEMAMEPEVINAVEVAEPISWQDEWKGERNQQPSNADVDPMTLYDRTSYERPGSSQSVIGNGIFDMEEGVTWRPRDGSFANDYALPQYLAEEDELGVQQSEMWDSTAKEWRVTQPSASGVALARRVDQMKPVPVGIEMRPEETGPRSHIEAFGRRMARSLTAGAMRRHTHARSGFLNSAMNALGPGTATRCRRAANLLMKHGYQPHLALEDAMAHCIMHAAVKDLTQKSKRNSSQLPRLDRMASKCPQSAQDMRAAAMEHIMPLTSNPTNLRQDLGALYDSPSARGMGIVSEEENGGTAPPPVNSEGMFTAKNMAIAGGLGLGAYFLFANRKTIAKNVKKWSK